MLIRNFDMKDIVDAHEKMVKPVNYMDLDLHEEDDSEDYGWWNPYAVYDPQDD